MSRFLVLAHTLPWPFEHGGTAQRTGMIRNALLERGEVDVCLVRGAGAIARDPAARSDAAAGAGVIAELASPVVAPRPWRYLRRLPVSPIREMAATMGGALGRLVTSPTLEKSLGDILRRRRYDVVVVRYLHIAARTGLLRASNRPPVILDIDDVDWLKIGSELRNGGIAGSFGRVMAAPASAVVERLARTFLERCDHVWAVTGRDARLLGLRDVSVLPNIPVGVPDSVAPGPQGAPVALFVGSLNYRPNRVGLERFLRSVWPGVRATLPTARFVIVGKGMPPAAARAWERIPGVEPVGFVNDLAAAYARASITVAPVYWGGGSLIKVLESLAHGRATVTTAYGGSAIPEEVLHHDTIFQASTDEDFVRYCCLLLRDPELRSGMGRRGRELILKRYSRASVIRAVQSTVERVLDTSSACVTARHLHSDESDAL